MGLFSKITSAMPAVHPHEAHEMLSTGATLLDVREPEEWRAGHAPGSHNVPLSRLAHWSLAEPEASVVVVCRSGHRSRVAVQALRQAGVDAVNLHGGMSAWHAAGLPMSSASGSQPRVL